MCNFPRVDRIDKRTTLGFRTDHTMYISWCNYGSESYTLVCFVWCITVVWCWAGERGTQARLDFWWEVFRQLTQTKLSAYLNIHPSILSIYESFRFLAPGPNAFVLALLHSHIPLLWCGSLWVICISTFALEKLRHVLSVASVKMNWMVWMFFSKWPGSDEKHDLFSADWLDTVYWVLRTVKQVLL